jgi:hypothetical protein
MQNHIKVARSGRYKEVYLLIAHVLIPDVDIVRKYLEKNYELRTRYYCAARTSQLI